MKEKRKNTMKGRKRKQYYVQKFFPVILYLNKYNTCAQKKGGTETSRKKEKKEKRRKRKKQRKGFNERKKKEHN